MRLDDVTSSINNIIFLTGQFKEITRAMEIFANRIDAMVKCCFDVNTVIATDNGKGVSMKQLLTGEVKEIFLSGIRYTATSILKWADDEVWGYKLGSISFVDHDFWVDTRNDVLGVTESISIQPIKERCTI